MPREKLPQVLCAASLFKIAAEQALNSIGHLARRATITHRTPKAGVLTHGAPKAKVISILDAASNLKLLPLQPDICNAMLAAAIWATGNLELQLLVKLRNSIFQLLHQPAGKSFGFSDRQFAEFTAGASHGAAPERRGRNMKTRGFQAKNYGSGACSRHVHNHQVLRVGGAKFSVTIAVSQIRCHAQLLWSEASAEHCRANIEEAGLFLPMDANMVSEDIIRLQLHNPWLQLVPRLGLSF